MKEERIKNTEKKIFKQTGSIYLVVRISYRTRKKQASKTWQGSHYNEHQRPCLPPILLNPGALLWTLNSRCMVYKSNSYSEEKGEKEVFQARGKVDQKTFSSWRRCGSQFSCSRISEAF